LPHTQFFKLLELNCRILQAILWRLEVGAVALMAVAVAQEDCLLEALH
jgi:hypothetical protein